MSTNIRFISTRFRNKKKCEHPFTRRVKLIFPVFRVYAAWSKLNLDPKCKHVGHFLNSSLDVCVHSVSIVLRCIQDTWYQDTLLFYTPIRHVKANVHLHVDLYIDSNCSIKFI